MFVRGPVVPEGGVAKLLRRDFMEEPTKAIFR